MKEDRVTDSFITAKKGQESEREAVAVIGIGCRFPGGVDSPAACWELLEHGVDAIVDVPADRWDTRLFYDPDPDKPGKSYVRQAGFLHCDPFTFDPTFFGISPREAEHLDPQQRLLLEVTWEAFDDAGLQAERLSGSSTGVFIGGFTADQHVNMMMPANRELITGHSATGNSMTVLASRIAYTFDLQGPCVTMDTACSSSLVAIHYACQSLWNGECDLAVAGGANFILKPEFFVAMCKGRYLSPDARCRAFDERASGYVRGEGAGVVLLKRISDAIRDRDSIYALVRGTGVNQDGQTNGMPMPNPRAQEQLIREVCRRANISPASISYIETHGTGTQAGDPAEAAALAAALSEGRSRSDKCLVGSIKTNIGHLEAASGVAGFIKTVLCLKHQQAPPSLHYQTPNPNIPFDEYCIRVVTEQTQLKPKGRSLLAGVNSFGFGGTNAHALLEEAPRDVEYAEEPPAHSRQLRQPGDDAPSRPAIVAVSAHNNEVLRRVARQLHEVVQGDRDTSTATVGGALDATKSIQGATTQDKFTLNDVAYTTTRRRSHLAHRLAVTARSLKDLSSSLEHFLFGADDPSVAKGHVLPEVDRKVVFVYTGMGPQWWGMGRDLAAREPVFRAALTECDERYRSLTGWSVLEAMGSCERSSRVKETAVAQPANFAIQVALTRLWASWGIQPDAVVGHSVGEVASAWASGALSLEEALLVSFHRGRLQQRVAGRGAMLAVGLSEPEAERLIRQSGVDGRVSVAAINSAGSLTLSGDKDAIRLVADTLAAGDTFHRSLDVEAAFHSYHMDSVRTELYESLSSLSPASTVIPLYSTVTGSRIDGESLANDYWWANVRQPVRFYDAIKALSSDGFSNFVEIGPHPVLRHAIRESLGDAGREAVILSSIDRKKPEQDTMLQSLASLYTNGITPDWDELSPTGKRIRLPAYPWQRTRYFIESRESREDRLGRPGHPLLSRCVDGSAPAWQVELNLQFFPFLNDHKVDGAIVVPGAFHVEAGLAVASRVFGEPGCVLRDISFHRILPFESNAIQDVLIQYDQASHEYALYARLRDNAVDGEVSWTRHAEGRLLPIRMAERPPALDTAQVRASCPEHMFADDLYGALERSNLTYGPAFRTIQDLWRGSAAVWARVEQSEVPGGSASEDEYLLHPTILDGCFQALMAAGVPESGGVSRPYVPVSIDAITLFEAVNRGCWCFGELIESGRDTITGRLRLVDDSGRILAQIDGLRCQAVKQRRAEAVHGNLYYSFSWEQAPLDTPEEPAADTGEQHWLIVADDTERARTVQRALEERGITSAHITSGIEFRRLDGSRFEIDPASQDDYARACEMLKGHTFSTVLFTGEVPGGRDDRTADDSPGDLHQISESAVHEAMRIVYLVQALSTTWPDVPIALVLVTQNAQVVHANEGCEGIVHAALDGLSQLIGQEYPQLNTKLIDVVPDEWTEAGRMIVDELCAGNRAEDVAIRSGGRWVKRLKRVEHIEKARTARARSTDEALKLDLRRIGDPEGLIYVETQRRAPDHGEIEVKVSTAGLNYKDVLKVYGKLAPEAMANTRFGERLGMDGAGQVVAVGPGVDEFEVGDEVAFMESGFRSYATIPVELAVRRPEGWSMEEAPVLLSTLTAYYGLIEVARLQPGETLLIHNGTGAVGLAAIKIAQWVGATVFATAGSDEKREYLRGLGVKHVFSSRTVAFAEKIRDITKGHGIDVVMGGVPYEIMMEGFALLAPYGRYVELGKATATRNDRLAMKKFNENLTFASVDVDRLARDRLPVVGTLLRKIANLCTEEHLRPLPVCSFSAAEVKEAFRFMGQGRHIGKVTLRMENEKVDVEGAPRAFPFPDREGTYLITGGTGGLGLELAKWLAARGAGGLALVSRSGASTEEARQAIHEIESQGTRVMIGRLDVADSDALRSFIRSLSPRYSNGVAMPPLRGVYHCAAVLDDALLAEIDRTRMEHVMAPKVRGVLNLHEATKGEDLNFFISFSSISSVVGNIGQCNYIAANAFLDAFARYRRAMGLPATSINLGALAETGIVSRKEHIGEMLSAAGVRGMLTETVLEELARITVVQPVQIGLFDMDWQAWSRVSPKTRSSSRFERLVAQGGEAGGVDSSAGACDLTGLDGEQREEAIRAELLRLVGKLLQLPSEKIDRRTGIMDMGVDSLALLELQLGISSSFGIEVSSVELLKGPSIDKLAVLISKKLEVLLQAAEGVEKPGETDRRAPDRVSGESGDANTQAESPVRIGGAFVGPRGQTQAEALEFAFLVHPRGLDDIMRAYPDLTGRAASEIRASIREAEVHVIAPIEFARDNTMLRGELITVPYLPHELIAEPGKGRAAVAQALSYCARRKARIAGLGALLPSVTDAGRALATAETGVGVTTGHTYTAIAIAEHVAAVKRHRRDAADAPVAVLGAAGSTGRAAVRCLSRRGERALTLVDLPRRRQALEALAAQLEGGARIATHIEAIREARILVCATNAVQALVTPDLLAEGCVVIDDAQPENVSRAVLDQRPDVTVLKCLAQVPDLQCDYDMGLFPPEAMQEKRAYTFTCLAEAVLLAAAGHQGHFTVGDPTDEQFEQLEDLARRWGVGIAPFHSFPDIGAVD